MRAMQIVDGDVVRSGGRAVILDDRETLKQRVEHRLSLVLGEWSYDKTLGLDWFSILGEKGSIQRLKQEAKRVIEADDEILRLKSVEVEVLNQAERKYRLTIQADSVYGGIAAGGTT